MEISPLSTSIPPNSNATRPVNSEFSLNQRIKEIYQKYIIENKYLNEVFHHFFKGIGFSLGAVLVLVTMKDLLIEVFKKLLVR